MKTIVIKIDKDNIDPEKIKFAADVIKCGGLVAFPTETVYGLGANALDETAVVKIFNAKGRPSDNPLIVHIAAISDIYRLVRDVPDVAYKLMDIFWPGPLTLVMHKSDIVPGIITSCLDTIAVRIPSHPVALALIKESGFPIAAPSANTSGKPSPTSAKHVKDDLSGKIDVIIDAGPTKVGLESTVLDLTVTPPVILRPGGVVPSQLEKVLGRVDIDPALIMNGTGFIKPKSPGMKYVHYSPQAEVIIVEGELSRVVARIKELADEYRMKGVIPGILATDQTKGFYGSYEVISAGDRDKPETIAANLFGIMREFDERHVNVILAEAIDDTGIGLAVMNRMGKAAGGNIIKT